MKEFKIKRFYLSDRNIEYLQDVKESKELSDDSVAIRTIINEHRELKAHLFDLNYIINNLKVELIKDVSKFISSHVLEEIRRVRMGTNNTDRNSQVLIELLTSYMEQSNIVAIASTDKHKPPFLSFAESVVHTRITHQKQKKDDKLNSITNGENVHARI